MSTKPRRTTRIVVDGLTWTVPFGFGADYRDRAAAPIAADALRDLMEIVGYTAELSVIEAWGFHGRVEVEAYCANVALRASGNAIRRHPKLAWLPEPWHGTPTDTSRTPTVILW